MNPDNPNFRKRKKDKRKQHVFILVETLDPATDTNHDIFRIHGVYTKHFDAAVGLDKRPGRRNIISPDLKDEQFRILEFTIKGVL